MQKACLTWVEKCFRHIFCPGSLSASPQQASLDAAAFVNSLKRDQAHTNQQQIKTQHIALEFGALDAMAELTLGAIALIGLIGNVMSTVDALQVIARKDVDQQILSRKYLPEDGISSETWTDAGDARGIDISLSGPSRWAFARLIECSDHQPAFPEPNFAHTKNKAEPKKEQISKSAETSSYIDMYELWYYVYIRQYITITRFPILSSNEIIKKWKDFKGRVGNIQNRYIMQYL